MDWDDTDEWGVDVALDTFPDGGLVPSQFYRYERGADPERRLLVATLKDALIALTGRDPIQRHEVRQWFADIRNVGGRRISIGMVAEGLGVDVHRLSRMGRAVSEFRKASRRRGRRPLRFVEDDE